MLYLLQYFIVFKYWNFWDRPQTENFCSSYRSWSSRTDFSTDHINEKFNNNSVRNSVNEWYKWNLRNDNVRKFASNYYKRKFDSNDVAKFVSEHYGRKFDSNSNRKINFSNVTKFVNKYYSRKINSNPYWACGAENLCFLSFTVVFIHCLHVYNIIWFCQHQIVQNTWCFFWHFYCQSVISQQIYLPSIS